MEKGKYILSTFLLLVVLTSSVYFVLNDNVRIDIEKTKSTFKVLENDGWVVSGIEYVNLFDGTAKMRAKNRSLETVIGENNITNVTRIANYKDDISTIEVYIFDPGSGDVELFPVSHSIQVINGEGKLLQYEVQKLLYSGETIKGIKSPQKFGYKMKVEWDEGNYYSKIYKYKDKDEGKLTVKYRIDSDDYFKNVRLFDPTYVDFNITITDGTYFYFYPDNNTHQEVSAYNQNSSIGVFTANNNLTSNISIYAKLNETDTNITLKIGNSSNYSLSVSINTSYQILYNNLTVSNTIYLWSWSDYNNATHTWFPELEIKGVEI